MLTSTKNTRKSLTKNLSKKRLSIKSKSKSFTKNKLKLNEFNKGIFKTIQYGISSYEKLINRKKKQYAGFTINPNLQLNSSEDAINFFISNSTASLVITDSYSGVIIILELNDGIPSPYTGYNTESILNQQEGNVKRLCIKLVKLKERREEYCYKGNEKQTETHSNFINEIAVQNVINLETSKNQESITPYIVYDTDDPELVERILDVKDLRENKLREDLLLGYYHPSKDTIGLLAMEFIENAHSLKDLIGLGDIDIRKYYLLSLYEFLRVAIETGIIHNDLHQGNIFIIKDYNYYLENREEKAIIIDWGKYITLPQSLKDQCKIFYDLNTVQSWENIIDIIFIKEFVDVPQLRWLRRFVRNKTVISEELVIIKNLRDNQIQKNKEEFQSKGISIPKISHYKDNFLPIKDNVKNEGDDEQRQSCAILGGRKISKLKKKKKNLKRLKTSRKKLR